MDRYLTEKNSFIIEDQELNISIQAPFINTILPEYPKNFQKLDDHSIVKVIYDKSNHMLEAFIEKEGQKHGQWLLFYRDQQKKMECFYFEGKLHGPSVFYNKEGKVLSTSWFAYGKREGKCLFYYPSGQLYSLQRFVNGVAQGQQEYFYPNGKKKTVINYQNGIPTGEPFLS